MSKSDNLFDKTAEEYDQWFSRHENAWRSELLALRPFIPVGKHGLEVGVGTGRFAAEFGIKHGVEPSPNMASLARKREIEVIEAVAENLPYNNDHFDFVLMVTIDCFVGDIHKSYIEAFRVLKPGGRIIIGMLDKNGEVAKKFESRKAPGNVYWNSHFRSPEEIVSILSQVGFRDFELLQTLSTPDPEEIEKPVAGYGTSSFVAIKAEKSGV